MKGYKWYVIALLIILVIAQPNLSKWLEIKDVVVSFVLFFIMLTAFGKKKPDIFIVPFAIGMMYDMLYSPWLGRMTIILLISTLTVMAVGKIVYKNHMPVLTAFFFISTYLLENLRALIETGPAIYFDSFVFIQGKILGISIYAAALAAFFGTVFFLQSFIRDRKLGARKSMHYE
jgi:hypothetical protein